VIRVTSDTTIFSLSADAVPAAEVAPGETVVLETLDCFSNQVQSADAPLESIDWTHVNPATGPVAVTGAEPGHVLVVHIDDIEVAPQGVMAVSDGFGVLSHHFKGMAFQMVQLENGTARVSGCAVPVQPMIGVIGVAPAGAGVPCGSPGSHGGNMDTRLIGAGATLYLPVFVPGALLAAGDLHAAMGDGEICGTGVEVAGRITLRVELRKDISLTNPVVETAQVIATIASAVSLDEAGEMAVRDMADLLMGHLGLSPADATMLMSAAGHLQVSQVVDPLKTARFAMPKTIVSQYPKALL